MFGKENLDLIPFSPKNICEGPVHKKVNQCSQHCKTKKVLSCFFFLGKKKKNKKVECNITECLVESNSQKFSFGWYEQALFLSDLSIDLLTLVSHMWAPKLSVCFCKKETLAQVFSCEICKNTFFIEQLRWLHLIYVQLLLFFICQVNKRGVSVTCFLSKGFLIFKISRKRGQIW